jgi:hypothetical protein
MAGTRGRVPYEMRARRAGTSQNKLTQKREGAKLVDLRASVKEMVPQLHGIPRRKVIEEWVWQTFEVTFAVCVVPRTLAQGCNPEWRVNCQRFGKIRFFWARCVRRHCFSACRASSERSIDFCSKVTPFAGLVRRHAPEKTSGRRTACRIAYWKSTGGRRCYTLTIRGFPGVPHSRRAPSVCLDWA